MTLYDTMMTLNDTVREMIMTLYDTLMTLYDTLMTLMTLNDTLMTPVAPHFIEATTDVAQLPVKLPCRRIETQNQTHNYTQYKYTLNLSTNRSIHKAAI